MSVTDDHPFPSGTADARSPMPQQVVTLRLHELAAGGEAVGRLADGRVVFVPGGAPEEEVEVVLTSTHRSYARAELVRVRSPGPLRVVPPCPLASGQAAPEAGPERALCGGCPLMHLDRAAQLRAKEEWVRRALRHSGAEVLPIQAPTPPLAYRVRARLLVRGGRLSFASARSHRAAAVSGCPVLEPALEAVLLGEGQAIAPELGEGGALSGLVGGTASRPAIHLAAEVLPGGRPHTVRQWLSGLLARGSIAGAILADGAAPAATAEVLGEPQIQIDSPLPGAPDAAELGPLWASADGFAQASAAGHQILPRLVGELVGAPVSGGRWQRLVELYAGSGNLTRALAPRCEQLVAIEGDAGAAARLRRRFAAASPGQARVQVIGQPAERALAEQVRAGARFDVAVLDPPRAGARAALGSLVRLGLSRLVYVSCDAMTLGRDLVELRAAGLRARSVLPLDLMPHTAQVECIALLERAAG